MPPKTSQITIPVPEGFSPPSSDPGKPFDIVDSWLVSDDGKTLTLCKVGDSDAPGYGANEEKAETENAPGYKGMATSTVNDMQSAGVPDPGY